MASAPATASTAICSGARVSSVGRTMNTQVPAAMYTWNQDSV